MNLYMIPSALAKSQLEIAIEKLKVKQEKLYKVLKAQASTLGVEITENDLSALGTVLVYEEAEYNDVTSLINDYHFLKVFGEYRILEGVKPNEGCILFYEEEYRGLNRIINGS